MNSEVVNRGWSIAVAAVLSLALPAAGAQTIYIHEDEDGVTHFTDRKPETEAQVTTRRAVAEPRNLLEVTRSGSEDDPVWLFRNRAHGPLAVAVELSESDNVVSEPSLPARFVLPARAERELVTFGPLDERESWRYRFGSRAVPGDPVARHHPRRAYRPPVAAGSAIRIGQAFDGSHSHQAPSARHAIDINLPVGTPVHAARGGVVMDFEQHFHGAGSDRERHASRANYIRILHDDGTMGLYAHLDYRGVEVRSGQRVSRGERIGRSGNTGFSTGPHLHFAVQVNRDMELVSVPFEFADADGTPHTPRRGLELRVPE